MQIRLTIGAKSAIATIDDNATARFPHHIAVNPAAGRLRRNREDHVSAEKTLDLGAPAGIDPDVGDITYAPWGNVAIFYRDSGYASD